MNSPRIKKRNFEVKELPWEKLKNFDFNTLKENIDRDVSKLKAAILGSQFSFPFYCWENYILDGRGRQMALMELETEGYEIPDLPVYFLEAENKEEAKKLVLMINSQHGEITQQSFDIFTQDIDIPIEQINIPYIQLEVQNIETDEDLPSVSMLGEVENKGDYLIVKFEDLDEYAEEKERLGLQNTKRVIDYHKLKEVWGVEQ